MCIFRDATVALYSIRIGASICSKVASQLSLKVKAGVRKHGDKECKTVMPSVYCPVMHIIGK
ncbi:hypothetical protein PPIS_b0627 [Pseudoalteromonas piscicida]|uniref:Uncharacterized protein n=1 Tax=Pseudoalteromonas piscicida TaxID=43662 RepID=A0ABN5CJG5_PSEO7|nr:hypothetical protein PPIS_b0627 [Pseudoalteromonas piscicida]